MLNENFSEEIKAELRSLIPIITAYNKAILEIGQLNKTYNVENSFKRIILSYMVVVFAKLTTSLRVLSGYNLKDFVPEESSDLILDQNSSFDILRSIYEAFVQVRWIVNCFTSDLEKNFIAHWWSCHALSEKHELKSLTEDEEVLLQEIKKYLIGEKFESLLLDYNSDLNKIKRLTSIPKWPRIGRIYNKAKVPSSKHEYIYKLLSNYSHVEPLALWELESSLYKPRDFEQHIYFMVCNLKCFSLLSFKEFSKVFSEVDEIILSDKKYEKLIKRASNFLACDDDELAF